MMTNEELAAIRSRYFVLQDGPHGPMLIYKRTLAHPDPVQLLQDLQTLFQHIEQLEAEHAALKAGIVEDQRIEHATLRAQLAQAQVDELDYGREVMRLRDENAALRERLAAQSAESTIRGEQLLAAEQREAQARALFHEATYNTELSVGVNRAWYGRARAWLAAAPASQEGE